MNGSPLETFNCAMASMLPIHEPWTMHLSARHVILLHVLRTEV